MWDLSKSNIFTTINVPVPELVWFSYIQQKDIPIKLAFIQGALEVIRCNSWIKFRSLFPLPCSKTTLEVPSLQSGFIPCHLSRFLSVIFVFSNKDNVNSFWHLWKHCAYCFVIANQESRARNMFSFVAVFIANIKDHDWFIP